MVELQFEQLPSILPRYLRALVSGRSASHLAQVEIPESRASVLAMQIDPVRLERFRQLLEHPNDGFLPPTYPQVLAAPLHLSLLTAKEFPLPATGLVHLGNTISCTSAIEAEQPIDLVAAVKDQSTTARGIEFTLATEVWVAGKCCWHSSSLLLARTGGKRGRHVRTKRPNKSPTIEVDKWRADKNIGRRYAAVSSDYNPIHLHSLTARVFGFRAPIAHGMWTLARSLTGFYQLLDAPYEIHAEFLRPVLLPAKVRLLRNDETPISFNVVDDRTNKAYMTGSIA